MSLKNRFAYYVIMILNYLIISNCQAAEGTIILNSQMPTKAVSTIATQSVVLKSGFHAVGSTGAFNAKIGSVNDVYPIVQLADGSTTLQLPEANEYASIGRNCTKTIIPRIETNNNSQLTIDNSLIIEEYSNGLGQRSMSVQKSITPQKKDLAIVANYDCFGRVTNQWLPTPIDGISSDPGFVIQQAQNFYADSKPYTTSATINSTDNIDGLSICKPGDAWHSGSKTMKNELLASNFTDPELIIRQYSVVDDKVVLTDDPAEFFSVAVLKTSDEDGKVKYQFVDAFDRTLLERRINDGQNHDTYYVYDNIGHLRFVLSPEASAKMSIAGNYILGSAINGDNDPLAQYAYVYKYDAHGRCVEKKLPGKDWNKMIYDQVDHLVFSQDGNQRGIDQWTYYKYDALDRLVQSGTTILTLTAANTIKTHYENATAVEAYEAGQGYTSVSQLGSNSILLTQNFYDNYDYLNLTAYSALKTNLIYKDYNNDATLNGFDIKYENLVEGVDIATQGMLTGTSVAMLDNSITLVNSMYYNDRRQVVQTRTNNHMNGYDNEFFHYNFSGQILNKRHVHKTQFIPVELTENYRMRYDNAGRLISLRHALNTQKEILMDSLVYDETGKVKQKILHGGIQHINYAYNIQNQVKSIHSESFAETLYRENSPYGDACFNGNISATTFGNESNKMYVYSYDQLNRLKSANYCSVTNHDFQEEVGNYDKNGNIKNINRYGYIYDSNYNITQGSIDDLAISYKGNQLLTVSDAANQSSVITTNDFLDKQATTEYLYDANGNQTADFNKGIAWIRYNLLNLPQKVQFSNGKKNEYLYDAAGVKHRAGYNYSTNSVLIPLGDTDPQKENNNLSTFQIDYCANYVYEKTSANGNPVLKRIVTPEGYISTFSATPMSYVGNWTAIYCLKDHQGNTRLKLTSDKLSNNTSKVYSASNQIDYYPFGMERSNTGQTSGGPLNSETIPYLYSGKEIDRINGLNEYDFGARWQDAAVPGFTTPDPLSELFFDTSPYAYCHNDPINRVDLDGMKDYYGYTLPAVPCTASYLWNRNSDAQSLAYLWSYNNQNGSYSNSNSVGEQMDRNRPGKEVVGNTYPTVISDRGDNSISKLITALSGINGMLGIANSQKEFVWSKLANSERNSIAYNIQKGLKASGERVLTSEIKASIKAGFKSTNVKLGAASVILIAANVVINEEIRPSDVMNTVMTGVAMTGWGAPIAAGYFIIDVGVSALNDGHGVSDLIDDQFGPIYDFKK